MLQGPVTNTVRAWCLADFETPNGVLNSRGVGQCGLTGGRERVSSHRLVNHLNDCLDRRIVYQLKYRLQAVRKYFGFLGVRER
jgi:hypothetical protein